MSTDTITTERRRANRLAREKSPYLLQHQYNPVDWRPWGEEAFARAREENKPIFLSIGYSTCHWCHVMERESFENETLARFLNDHFVSIKVDREERPDVDRIYMTFVQATTGQGGWPLNVFLTPDLRPFYGGTYFPPTSRQGRPGLLQVLEQVADLWKTRQKELAQSAAGMHARLQEAAASVSSAETILTADLLRQAGAHLKQVYDPSHGGFGSAPKFPQPSHPQFLLRYAKRFQDQEALRMVLHTCDRMAAGGIHDQLGGGFSRYSVDAQWLVPHFEKMLYDNAQLVELYLDAYLASGESRHAAVARDIIAYVLRDLTHPEGAFYSAEDADSEGHEGKFYCWTREELASLLAPEEFQVAVRHFGITEQGNFLDHSHPQPLAGQNVLSVVDDHLSAPGRARLQSAKAKMLAARAQRVRPHLDDKVLASWNGLMVGALARAYAVLGDQRYLRAAEKNLAFVEGRLWEPATKSLSHRWRDNECHRVQLLESYAFLLAGVLDLYEATLEPKRLELAIALAESMLVKFYDPSNGGFWQTAPEATDVILRTKPDYDGAEPSGNSVAILALLRLGKITAREEFLKPAGKSLSFFADRLRQVPQALPYMLQALDFRLEEPKRVVITGRPTDRAALTLLHAANSVYEPNKVVLGAVGPVEPMARDLASADGGPLAYLCTGTACQKPTGDPAELRRALSPSAGKSGSQM